MFRHLFLAALAACAIPAVAAAQSAAPHGRYIVVLNDGRGMPEDVAADVAVRTGGQVGYVYEHALQGFSIFMPRAAAAALARDPRVASVEEDRPVSISAQSVPTGIKRIFADTNTSLDIDGVDDARVDVDVAVIDTGIDASHPDLNVAGGVNCLQSTGKGPPFARSYYCTDAVSSFDDNNHGTHVGGTIGALDNGIGVVGVAPGARLWAVKVLDASGSGYESSVVAGMDWVVANATTIEVANMSLGGSGTSSAEQTALTNAMNAGIVFVAAAGNDARNLDTNAYSPGGLNDVITVSALADFNGVPGGGGAPTCRSDIDDTLADFSNYGSKVEIAAPGVCILSTLPGNSYGPFSGTSMATPHVAGAAALLASGTSKPHNRTEVLALTAMLLGAGNFNWFGDSTDNIQEPLLDVSTFIASTDGGGGDGGGGGGNIAPVANNDSYSTPYNTPIVVGSAAGVLVNDTDSNDDSLTAMLSGDGPINGTLSLSEDGGFTYTPNSTYFGADSFTYVANDGTADSNPATVTITVNAPIDSGTAHVAALNTSHSSYGKGGSKHDLTTTVNIANDSGGVSGVNFRMVVQEVVSGTDCGTVPFTTDSPAFKRYPTAPPETALTTDGSGNAGLTVKFVSSGSYCSYVLDVAYGTGPFDAGEVIP